MVPVERVEGRPFAAQLRRQDVPGHAVVQRRQVAAVELYPLAGFLLQEGPDDGEGRLHVPRLTDEVDRLEAHREAVLGGWEEREEKY